MSRRQGRSGVTLRERHRSRLVRSLWGALAIVLSAPADLDAERLPLQTYNHSNGLAHDRVRCVVPDSRGFVWFCTADGLSRFDGSRFVNYGLEQGLPHPAVEAIAEAGPGVYWVATEGGLARLRSVAGASEVKQDTGALPLTAFSLGSGAAINDVMTLKKDRAGRLWIGTLDGLFILERPLGEPSFRRVEPDPVIGSSSLGQVRALAEGHDGTLWIGASSGLFRSLPDGRIVRDAGLASLLSRSDYSARAAEGIRSLLVDGSGRLWIGQNRGLTLAVPMPPSASPSTPPSIHAALPACRFNGHEARLPTAPGESCRFETIAQVQAFARTLSLGSDGRVWIGTPEGLVEFDGERFRAYSERHGLSHKTINAVGEDRAGNVWIGTDAGGVCKRTKTGFVSFREEDGLAHNYVTSISQSRAGRVRAGGGWPVINEFDGERFTAYQLSVPGRLEPARVYDLLEDHAGDLWVGTPGGVFRFPEMSHVAQLARGRPRAIYTVANGLPAAWVAPAFEDSRGDIWMTAHLGPDRRVVRWQRSTRGFHQYPETDSPATMGSQRFAEDGAGNVWHGSSGGLFRHRDGGFGRVEIETDAGPARVTGLHVDSHGRLWIGTRGTGLYRSDDPAAERPRFAAYTVAHGLSSGTVWCLTDDGAGHVYAGTARGVDRLHVESGQFRRFSAADGLAGGEVIAAFRDSGGALWFGTFTGVSRFTPRPDSLGEPPTVWIGGLRVRGVAQALEHLGQADISMRNLSAQQNHVEIEYFALSPSSGDVRYQYQLEGTDSAWTPPTAERRVNYAELAPGSYRVLVRAVTMDGRTSGTPASVSFTIVPPVWQRWWFFTILASLAIASGYAVHAYRVRRLLEIERLRTRIASDLHDDVGSSLSQISILSEVLRTHLGSAAAHIADPLLRIGTLSRESVDSMGDIVWAIDPVRDTPIHLVHRMRRAANELLGAAGVQLRFDSSGDASPRLNAEVRHHVFLIFKEILNNVVRYAEASAVSVEVTVASRQLRLSVTDDGRGFEPGGTEGQGLRSMQRRAADLGGSLQVTSHTGSGTRITLTIPLH